MTVRDTAGKRVKCPTHGDRATVAEEYDEEEERPRRKSRREQYDDEDNRRPRKKSRGGKSRRVKARNPLPLILGVGIGAFVLLAVVGVGVGVLLSSGLSGSPANRTTQAQNSLTGPSQPGVPAAPRVLTPPRGWSVFKGDGFRVAVPDEVQFRLVTQVFVPGAPLDRDSKTYRNGAASPHGWVYSANIITVAKKDMPEFSLNPGQAWDEAKKPLVDSDTRFEDERAFSFAGLEGREATLNVPSLQLSGVMRMVVKGNKVYTWAVLGKARPAANDPNIQPFFDSFTPD